jgi:hypothetical protein
MSKRAVSLSPVAAIIERLDLAVGMADRDDSLPDSA